MFAGIILGPAVDKECIRSASRRSLKEASVESVCAVCCDPRFRLGVQMVLRSEYLTARLGHREPSFYIDHTDKRELSTDFFPINAFWGFVLVRVSKFTFAAEDSFSPSVCRNLRSRGQTAFDRTYSSDLCRWLSKVFFFQCALDFS